MKLFFDTNVLLDHALMRETGQPLEISFLIFWAFKNNVPIIMSSGSIYTFTYILHKQGFRGQNLRDKIRQYLTMFHICDTSKDVFTDGLDSNFKDLEDSFQYMNAIKDGCDYLITSNIADFKPFAKGKIEVHTPKQFVNDVLKEKISIDL